MKKKKKKKIFKNVNKNEYISAEDITIQNKNKSNKDCQ